MTQRTHYLVTRHDRKLNSVLELRVPKSTNIKLLLERLICRDLDDETLVASCLPRNSKHAFDPFQIIDEREEHRREQARAALDSESGARDPIGIYRKAWQSPIPLGKTLMFAGAHHEYFVKEVEASHKVHPRRRSANRQAISGPLTLTEAIEEPAK